MVRFERDLYLISLTLRKMWTSSVRYKATAALYVHWPYCKKRCTYCNFNKYIDKSVDHGRMEQCLITEAQTLISLANVTEITSVFFGGGTPSLAVPQTIKNFLDAVQDVALLSDASEVSMEVNPTSLEMDKLVAFKEAGVNRVSIGVQTLSSAGLHILGRDHSAQESLKCLAMAKSLFPGRVSVDLIFGWPTQTLDMWTSELEQVLPICDNHISLYQLTLERGTQLFKDITTGKLTMVQQSDMEDMYLQAVKMLASKGFERYEVSNFAKQKAYSQHNMAYWTGYQYIGVGPGAHGRFKPKDKTLFEARVQTLEPKDWIFEVEHFGHATRKASSLSTLQRLEVLLCVGLRTKWGVLDSTWMQIYPESMKDMLLHHPNIKFLEDRGLLLSSISGLRATDEGMNVIDGLLPDILNCLAEAYSTRGTTHT